MDNLTLAVNFLGNYTNKTDSANHNTQPYVFLLILQFVLVITAILLNLTALVSFLSSHIHRTPFNTVVVNLLISNFLFLALESPYAYAMTKDGGQQLLGMNGYLVYAYIIRYTASVEVFSHAVVSANRFWAVTWPYHYRQHCTLRTSIWICGGIWLFAHVITIPSIMVTVNYTWTTLIRFIPLTMLAFILASFPYIWCKRKKRRKRTEAYQIDVIENGNGSRQSGQQGSPPESGPPNDMIHVPRKPRRFLLLACLTLSIFLNWTPTFILEILFPYYRSLNMARIRDWLVIFYTLQCVVDPILFSTTLNVSLYPFNRAWFAVIVKRPYGR